LKHPDAEAEFAPKESMKTTPNLGLAIVGGFVGTPAMTVTVYLLGTLIGVKMNFVDALATMLGGWKMGMLVHVLNGAIIFPLAYVVFLYRFFPGPAYVKGLTFGLMLWLTSQLLILPLIGAGLFSSQMGGIRASGTLLLGHLVYGVLLGSLAGSAIEGFSAAKPRANHAA
jgi:uncharacterized membrane protein YagU involved in acid resistance